ncbi:MAG: CHAT domain-containing protein, partial [Planctomycetota bacterium]
MSEPSPGQVRVFCCHRSTDKAAVKAVVDTLRQRGIDAWFDIYEIDPGSDFVAEIEHGLERSEIGLVFLSATAGESVWVRRELSYFTWASVHEGKTVVPVVIGADAWIPPLMRPLDRVPIEDVERLIDAIHGRPKSPRVGHRVDGQRVHRFELTVDRDGDELTLSPQLDGHGALGVRRATVRPSVQRAVEAFARGEFLRGTHRGPDETALSRAERSLTELGHELWGLLLPTDVGEALLALLEGVGGQIGSQVELRLRSDDPWVLGLPVDALREPNGSLLALRPTLSTLRGPKNGAASVPALAGPLKVLVAVAAPDETKTQSAVLDLERELQNILDAVESEALLENTEVQILEVGHPVPIVNALKRDQYQVLHVSCHGGPGTLELETEEGAPHVVSASELVDALRTAQRPLPLVFLSACHGAREAGDVASVTAALLAGGVRAVVTTLGPISDAYATELARHFYEALAVAERPLASRALADARRRIERARSERRQRACAPEECQPEFGTVALFVAGEESGLIDRGLAKEPIRERSRPAATGPVPLLGLGDLVGRRNELRDVLRILRGSGHAGLVLLGIGGVGKSSVAGRAMAQLGEQGWAVAAVQGRFDIAAAAREAVASLTTAGRSDAAAVLRAVQDDELASLAALRQILGRERLLLVFDDFEQNLPRGGGGWIDGSTPELFGALLLGCQRGRILVTSRHPLPGMAPRLAEVHLGPLSTAQARKLVRRLPALHARSPQDVIDVLRTIGGHPRVLEFLDGLLRGGQARLARVTEKLQRLANAQHLDLTAPRPNLSEAAASAVALGARDVFLEELLGLAQAEGHHEVLLHAAVSNLPIELAGLSRLLDEAGLAPLDLAASVRRLVELSLLVAIGPGATWVHRWTAEGFCQSVPGEAQRARANRVGRYRGWRVANETHALEDAQEAVRNFLTGEDYDAASATATACLDAMERFRRTGAIAAFASEVCDLLPTDHPGHPALADRAGRAFIALGLTDRALRMYRELLARFERLAELEPDRSDYQRDLSVFYERMGDLYRALGQGQQAREAFQSALEIAQRLAELEPDRSDYQRDLSVFYERMGDLYRALGQGQQAREYYEKDLEIAQRLAELEPDRSDYQRDLSVSYNNMGDLYRALGQGQQAREAFQSA